MKFYKEFKELPAKVKDTILQETFDEMDGKIVKHSLKKIYKQARELTIGSRMTSKPIDIQNCSLNNGQVIMEQNKTNYDGASIAQIYIDSVNKFGKSYYPIYGDWTDTGAKYLVLFVKDKEKKMYIPVARFKIVNKIKSEEFSIEQLQHITDISPALSVSRKTILEIEEVEENDIPQSYIGIRSGVDIYESAFKGSSPNILML